MVLNGAVGEVRHVEASYLQSWLVSHAWGDWRTEPRWLWRLSTEHGSNGVLGDVGVHILDFVIYGTAIDIKRGFGRLQTFHKAEDDRIGDYPLDANDSFTLSVEFTNGALGMIHASRFGTGYLNTLRLRIFGDRGALEVQHGVDGSSLRACVSEDIEAPIWQDVVADPVKTNYQRFVEAVTEGRSLDPTFRHATYLQKILDLAMATDRERQEQSAL
jgi:predicted dehydrogenase